VANDLVITSVGMANCAIHRARVGRDEAVARLKSAKIIKGNMEQQWAGLRRALRRRTSVAQQGESSP
jgi:hypothetical protein